jgi:undecaprenyl-diphosphatase
MLLSIRQFSEQVQRRELALLRRANRLTHGRVLWRFFAVVSRLGDGIFWYALLLALLLAGGVAGQIAATQMAVLGMVSLLLYKAIKHWSKRPRPLAVEALNIRVLPLDEFSFPSGHTLHAIGFTVVATHWFPWLGLLLWPFAACVALSRVVLGLHYPSDVLAAIVLGWALSETSFLLLP